ncbi:MAG: hypothetical protein IJZ53_13555 [Tyzzerella sp.]|nr:hypothetical protein [Tyzzerella sp.]
MKTRLKKRVLWIVVSFIIAFALIIILQKFFAHCEGFFTPDYPQADLSEESDYELIFLQTGLGRSAADKLITQGEFQVILDIQDTFFRSADVECVSLLGWFTREDRIEGKVAIPLVDLQPGDIILTLSTHSLGWRHGHAGLVLDEDSVLECVTLGKDSVIVDASHWNTYSNFAVLRVKQSDEELREEVAFYAKENLCGIPYHLSSGFIGEKAPELDAPQFGMHCSYLVWYAWNHFGYDLDSDGGRLVTSYDLLHSGYLEVVQIYGMDPRVFILDGN